MGKAKAGIFMAVLLLAGMFAQTALAGGIDNKQNFSARYLATGSRNAATDSVDAAAYNPAGIMFQQNGFGLGLDVHYIFKDYEQKYTQVVTGAAVTRDQDEPSIIPGLFGTYKSDSWGLFGTVTNNGGGGKVKYENGNAVTNEVQGLLLAAPPNGFGLFPGGVMTSERIEAESHYITYTLGGTYKFNEMVSVAAGARYVDATKDVEAFATTTGVGNLQGAYEEDADGWGWVASVNIRPMENLLFGIRYESKVELEFETNLKGGNTPLGNNVLSVLGKTQNAKSDRDLPAVLGLGASWDATDRLNLNTSFTYYFEEDADWDGQEDTVDNSYDIAISATYSFLDYLRGSIGYMYTDVGMDAKDFGLVEKMSPVLDAHSFFCGLGYDVNDAITLDLGVMINFYEEDTAASATGKPTYDKQNTAIALGIAFKF